MEPINGKREEKKLLLWNPISAIWFGAIISPIFGAFIQALNWKAVGKDREYSESMAWSAGCAVIILILIVAGHEKIYPFFFVLFALWYFFSARKQADALKEYFDNGAQERGIILPAIIYLAAMFAVIAAVEVVENQAWSSKASSEVELLNDISGVWRIPERAA